MVEITELNREPASTVSTLTATTEVTSPSIDATDVTSDTLTASTEVTSPSVTTDALEAGGADIETDWFNKIESGPIAVGDGAVLAIREVADGETMYITQAVHLIANGTAAPSGYDLTIATLNGAGGGTERQNILTGDGTTIYDDQTGSPLASWTNNTESPQTTAVIMDNGQFSGGASDEVDGYAEVTGRVAL